MFSRTPAPVLRHMASTAVARHILQLRCASGEYQTSTLCIIYNKISPHCCLRNGYGDGHASEYETDKKPFDDDVLYIAKHEDIRTDASPRAIRTKPIALTYSHPGNTQVAQVERMVKEAERPKAIRRYVTSVS